MSLKGNCPRCKRAHSVYSNVGVMGDFTHCQYCVDELKLQRAQLEALTTPQSAPTAEEDGLREAAGVVVGYWKSGNIHATALMRPDIQEALSNLEAALRAKPEASTEKGE